MKNTSRRRFMLAGGAVLALAGCSNAAYRSDFSAGGLAFGDDVDEALRYHQYIRTLSPAELNKEYTRVGQGFARTQSDLARIELVLLLTAPNASFRDEGVALNLLKEWLQKTKPPYSGLRALGGMLVITIEEMREKDRRMEALQKKLDALKTMEKNLIEREKR